MHRWSRGIGLAAALAVAGDGSTTLTFSAPERADDPTLPIPAGEYRATLTFHVRAS